jgi:hypothetical protein
MTLQEVLLCSDHEIVRSGQMTVLVAREWQRITGREPSACDCQTKNYLRVIRQFYNTQKMENDLYIDGRYYDKSTITETEKENILASHPSLYTRLFGEIKDIPQEIIEENPKTPAKKVIHK